MADNDPKPTPEGKPETAESKSSPTSTSTSTDDGWSDDEAEADDKAKPAKTDDPPKAAKTDDKAKPAKTDDPPKAAKADDKAKPAKADDKPKTAKADDKREAVKADDKAKSGARAKPIDMGTSLKDVVKTVASGSKAAPAPAAKARSAAEAPKTVNVGGESFVDRVLPHMKKIILTVIVITVVLSGVFGYRSYQETKKEKATDKLVQVIVVGERPVRPPGMPVDPKEPTYADAKERAAAVVDAIAKQDSDPGHAYHGNMLVAAGRLDEAITEFKLGQDALGLDGVLCREGIGLAQEAKASSEKDPAARQKGFEDALATFKTMQPDETGPRRAYAMYHQGRMLQLLGKTAEAKAAYEKAKELAKGTDLEPDERELMANPRLPRLIETRLGALGAS